MTPENAPRSTTKLTPVEAVSLAHDILCTIHFTALEMDRIGKPISDAVKLLSVAQPLLTCAEEKPAQSESEQEPMEETPLE